MTVGSDICTDTRKEDSSTSCSQTADKSNSEARPIVRVIYWTVEPVMKIVEAR